jgi:hypothetical protein
LGVRLAAMGVAGRRACGPRSWPAGA